VIRRHTEHRLQDFDWLLEPNPPRDDAARQRTGSRGTSS
jgi:hypothetical protein